MALEKLQKLFHFSPGNTARFQVDNRERGRERKKEKKEKMERERERERNRER